MKINEVARLTGTTVRALHYYDKMGLLSPPVDEKTGYRIYGERELEILQQILFFRELDFSLKEIKEILGNPDFDKEDALRKQKELLLEKRNHVDGLIALVEKTLKGEEKMSFQEFETTKLEKMKEQYAKEVKERWGNTDSYTESEEKAKKYGKKEWNQIMEEQTEIFREFYAHLGEDAGSEAVQALVKKWQDFITAKYYVCTREILAGLGQMYTADERFQKNIDEAGAGTARFLSEAIKIYCSR